jgi:tetraacyldisaccharide 4'-kinase
MKPDPGGKALAERAPRMKELLEALERFAIEVICERRHGKRASLLRGLLFLLSVLYGWVVSLRLWMYQKGICRVHPLGCLIISVGNLTVGGTGKTPIVEKLAKELTASGRRVAILSRGYKSRRPPLWRRLIERLRGRPPDPPRVVSDGKEVLLNSELAGDEPYMLAKNLPKVAVLVSPNRVLSGLYAIRHFGADTLILDDGFQYLPLRDRLDLVLVDSEVPFGNGKLLPRGTLREPPRQLKRADVILLTKCDGSDLSALRAELRRLNPHAPMVECAHSPRYLENVFTGERVPLEILQGLKVGTLSGIARPESFEKGLKRLGAILVYSRRFEDHHRFTVPEVQRVMERSRARLAKAVVTTEKDAVRIPPLPFPLALPLYFLRVEIEFLRGEQDLDGYLERAVRGRRGPTPLEEPQRSRSNVPQPVPLE